MTVCNFVCGNKVELSLASVFMAELLPWRRQQAPLKHWYIYQNTQRHIRDSPQIRDDPSRALNSA